MCLTPCDFYGVEAVKLRNLKTPATNDFAKARLHGNIRCGVDVKSIAVYLNFQYVYYFRPVTTIAFASYA
jgi:hypothetical protein